ncbi:MAG: TetR family transcriptional regulator [Pseudomonadota bacterium]
MKKQKMAAAGTDTVRVRLDCARIAQTALGLIDQEGIEQLSMRRIGAALGVEAMALYHHFRNKAELLDGVKDHLLQRVEAGLTPGAAPLETLRESFCALRQIGVDHPDIFPGMGSARYRTERAMQYYERLFDVFYAAGLNAEQSARYYRLLSSFTVGTAIAQPPQGARAVAANAPAVSLTPVAAQTDERMRPIDGAPHVLGGGRRFPTLRQISPFLEGPNMDAIFQFGLDTIFSTLRAELAWCAQSRATTNA